MVRAARVLPLSHPSSVAFGPAAFLCALLTGLSLSLSSCSLPDETAALVNDKPLPTERLDSAYEVFLDQFGEMAPSGEAEARRVRKALLDRLIDQELMMQEVHRRNLLPSEEEVSAETSRTQGDLQDAEFMRVLGEAGLSREEWKEKLILDMAVEKLQRQVVYDSVTVSGEEITGYLALHRTNFEESEKVRASQILVRTREEAVGARKRIRAGESFADVAREISLSPDSGKGGDLGFFARGQMPPEFEAVIFSLPKDKLSPVVETTYGYHLFLVTGRREARQRSEEDVRGDIRDLLAAEKGEQAFRDWLNRLRQNADIRYNDKIVPK
jgi:parvulin-like peptidyl-prolyl isomerase